jgi:hypothetical protein
LFEGRQLTARDHMDIDAEVASLSDDAAHDEAAGGKLLPTALLTGAEHYLGYLVLLGEVGYRLGGVRVDELEPISAQVVYQGTYRFENGWPRRFGIGGVDVQHAELAFGSRGQARRAP